MENLESSLMEDHTFAATINTDTYTLVKEKQAVMHPSSGGNPTLRKAHFLKPIFSEDHAHLPSPPSLKISSKPIFQKLKKPRLLRYKGHPSEKWKIWVHSLKPKYQEIWKQAGIYEAILASTYKIPKENKLIMGLAERWCAETNTFVFPWGEVTITLEDVMFLGSYSVLGALFSTPLDDESVGTFDNLKNAYKIIKLVSGAGQIVSTSMWMKYFMCSGKELEHEAFLAMWLSSFVLVNSYCHIAIQACHIAIHLSQGNRIALAPVVLASIYKNLRLLHNSLVESIKLVSVAGLKFIVCNDDLVHMWAWERFPRLRPTPIVLERGEPRSARWNGVKVSKVKDVNAALDSAKESFMWRPYIIDSSNCMLSKLSRDTEQWVAVESDDIESFARCLRVSELAGLGYIEQYLPHRVAMQFGLDQDVPPPVIRSSESPEAAWSSYNRSMRGMKLYIPPRLFESDVSPRYVVWLRGFLSVNEEMVTTYTDSEKHLPLISSGRKRGHANVLSTSGCLSKRPEDYVEEDNLTTEKHLLLISWGRKRGRAKPLGTFGCLSERQDDHNEEDNLALAESESRSRKTLSKRRTKIFGKSIDLGNMPELNIHSGTKTPAKLICTIEAVKSGVQGLLSSDKCKESNSVLLKEPVLSNAYHAEVSNVDIELTKDEVLSKANCPDTNIVNIEGESWDNTTSEIRHLGLMSRILRLEKIVEEIKAAKHDVGYF